MSERGCVCRSVQPPRVKMCVKTDLFFLRDFNRATHFSIIFIFPRIFCFAFLYPSTSVMCFQTIPGIGSWTPPLLHIHYITGSHHTGTWLLLPFLCWWHTALSLISTRWSNGSCTDLRLPGGHLGMDERTSPTAQPGKDWASCLPCNSNSTGWFHDSVRFINNYPPTSVRNLGVIFDDQLTFKKSTLQRLLDLAGLHFTTSERSGPFWQSMLHNFLSRPWSFLGWTTAMLF